MMARVNKDQALELASSRSLALVCKRDSFPLRPASEQLALLPTRLLVSLAPRPHNRFETAGSLIG